MTKLSFWRTVCLVCVFCAGDAITSPAQTFKTLVDFNGTDGLNPYYESLVQGAGGNFYGTTEFGGALPHKQGTVFKITPGGTLTTLHTFTGISPEGEMPYAGLILATDGNFYGTTNSGGANGNWGTVFRISSAGTLTTLYSFGAQANCLDGCYPFAGLVQATDGNFYGTTSEGGGSGGGNGNGTVFRITPAGTLTTLYSFCAETYCADGSMPMAGLVQATDGNFYGTTLYGGTINDECTDGCGTVFKITPDGTLTTLHSFDVSDGEYPYGALVQAANGNFYGTTDGGGAHDRGTVFEISPGGTLTTLYSFCSQNDCTDGKGPAAGLIRATDGNFYGTTVFGGTHDDCILYNRQPCGTVFKITPDGTLTVLHSFDGTDGEFPWGGLVQGTNGTFYGTTTFGANSNCTQGCGTVFSLAVGLGPFVETLPTSGSVGQRVVILGNNLTGSTRVMFNGTAATFTVVSSAEIKTTVPRGATTGKVKVTTPGRTLTSNVNFRVP
jgi:uncharacterized repeat protein (TIGR03803 family)